MLGKVLSHNKQLFEHRQGVLQFSSVLTLSGDSIGLCMLKAQAQETLPSQPKPPVDGLGCYPYFTPIGCKSEVPTASFLGSIDLLEQPTELRGIIFLTRLTVHYKRLQLRTVQVREIQQASYGKGLTLPCTGLSFSPHVYMFTNLDAPFNQFWVSKEA